MMLTDKSYLAELNKLSVTEIEAELKKRKDIDQLNEQKESPLHIAARLGYVNVADALTKAGANKEATDQRGDTPLHCAAVMGHKEVVEFLLNAGANKDAVEPLGYTPLHFAAQRGHKEVVEVLLKSGANKEAVEQLGCTPLLLAALKGHNEVVEVLLSKGANKEATDQQEHTPLHFAAGTGHEEVVEILLKAGANKEAVTEEGSTPLHNAAAKGHKEVVEVLLKAGANKEATDQKGTTPLHFAVANGHKEVVEVLLSKGANKEAIGQLGYTPLHIAVVIGHKEVVEVLINKGANKEAADQQGNTLMHLAAANGHKEVVEVLLEAGANKEAVEHMGYTPLHIAAGTGHKELVEVLLKAGANEKATDKQGATPLHFAAAKGHKEVVEVLLSKGANKEATDQDGSPPLHTAAANGHKEVVEVLLSKGANKEAIDKHGATPLHVAASNGQKEVVEVLLKAGANKEATAQDGSTPLHTAAQQGHKEVVELLLKAGANKEAIKQLDYTPLLLAALEGNKEVVEVLLKAGANKKAVEHMGYTLLHIAAGTGNKELVEVLLKAGANEKATDKQGATPLHFAAGKGHKEVVELLLKAGANKEATVQDGSTPLHTAAANGHKAVVEVLLSKGADVHKKSQAGKTPLYIAVAKGDSEVASNILQVYEQNACSEFSLAIKEGDEQAIATLLTIGAKVPKADAVKLIPMISGDSQLLKLLWEQGKPQAEKRLMEVISFISELDKATINIPDIVNSDYYKRKCQDFNDRREDLGVFIKGEMSASGLAAQLTKYYGYIDEISNTITFLQNYLAKTKKQEIRKLDVKLAEFVAMRKKLETVRFISGRPEEEYRCSLLNKVAGAMQAIKTAKQHEAYVSSKEEVFQEIQESYAKFQVMGEQLRKQHNKNEQSEKLKAKYVQNLAELKKDSEEEVAKEIGFELKKELLELVPMVLRGSYVQVAAQLEEVCCEFTQLRAPEKVPEGEEEDSVKLEKFTTAYAKWKKERAHLKSERVESLEAKNTAAQDILQHVHDRVTEIKELKSRLGIYEVYQEEVIELKITIDSSKDEEQLREYISQKYAFSDVALQSRYIGLVKNHQKALGSLFQCKLAIRYTFVSDDETEEKTYIKLDHIYQVYLDNVAKEIELNKAKELLFKQSMDRAKSYHLDLYNKLAKHVGILTEELKEYKVDAPFYKDWVCEYENIFEGGECKSPWEVAELEEFKLQIELINKQLSKLPEHIKDDARYKALQEASTKKDSPEKKTSSKGSCEEEITPSRHKFFAPVEPRQRLTLPFYGDLRSIIISDIEDPHKRWLDALARGKGKGCDQQVKFIFCKMHSLSLMRFFGMLAIAGCNADQKRLFSNLRNFFMHYESELEQEDLFYYFQCLKDVVIGAKSTFLFNSEGYANEIYTKYQGLAKSPQLSSKVKSIIRMCLQQLPDEDVQVKKTFTVVTKLLEEFKQLSIYFADQSLKACLSEVNREFKLAFLSTACQIGEKLQKLSIAKTHETIAVLEQLQADKPLWYFLNLCRDARDAVGHAYGEECKEITYDALFSKEGMLSKLERFYNVKEIDRTISCFETVVTKQPTVACSPK